jgi:hypothetical protein
MSWKQHDLAKDHGHFSACHSRWIERRRYWEERSAEDEDSALRQCGGCRFYVELVGAFHYDWGVCTNPNSAFDGRAMFEHDGCEAFAA